jgi:hypothetical protein
MTEQRVYKTLVIGLGSTGARVVDRLASAVAWELGGGEKAPWLEYLCLETDANELAKLPHVRPEDFRVLGVDKTEFALMVANPSQFDPTNGLSSWIDLPTVRKLPDGSVQSGVGNIRMVGRLAFLHKANFEVVKQMVARRLDRLRALTANAATEARGKLQGGANPPVTFASPHVQVYVVGTLCGGTASGVAGDMGFFVRSLLHDGETVTAMFTVPRPDFTAALNPLAERFKTNSYHALVELNHYHLPERTDEAPVRFPDGTQSRVGDFPYDLTFVLMPKELGPQGEDQVNQAVADRLFLHVFSVQTNTAGQAINAVPFGTEVGGAQSYADRDHRAHVFCTFGLSVVDYPIQRVMEACQAKLLEETLSEALARNVDDGAATALVQRMKLDWDALVDDLYAVDDGMEQRLTQERRSIRELARTDPQAAVDRFEKLRRAFHSDPEPGAGLLDRGGVTAHLRARRGDVVGRAMARVAQGLADAFADPELGPTGAIKALTEAKVFVGDLLQRTRSVSTDVDLERSARTVAAYGRHPLLVLLGVSGVAARHAQLHLDRDLGRALDDLKRQGAANALFGEAKFAGAGGERGILTDLLWRVEQALRRANGLRSRLFEVRGDVSKRYQSIEGATPANGFTLYQTTQANTGSVHEAYERALVEASGVVGIGVADAHRLASRKLLGVLAEVTDDLVREASAAQPTWLDATFVPGGGTPPLTTELRDRLFGASMEHFSSIATTNVLQLLDPPAMTEARSDQIVTEAAKRSSPFLVVQHDLATRGGRSPVAATSVALVPGNGRTADRVWARIASGMSGNPKRVDGQEVHRIVMIQEQYRFPLSGVPTIAGAEGVEAYLGKAVCNDFPTFWTRADVPWTKVSDAEVAAVGRAEEIVAAALLTGVARVEAGAILIPWEREFGGVPQRRLRATFRKAVRQVAEQGPDLDGAGLSGAAEKLRLEVVAALRAVFAEHTAGDAGERFERFVVKRFDDMVTTPPVVPLPDFPRGERLVPVVQRFIAREPAWFEELKRLHPISPALRAALFRTKGASLASGMVAPDDAYYCPACGGLLGRDDAEATLNGWRCFAFPDLHNKQTNFGNMGA